MTDVIHGLSLQIPGTLNTGSSGMLNGKNIETCVEEDEVSLKRQAGL